MQVGIPKERPSLLSSVWKKLELKVENWKFKWKNASGNNKRETLPLVLTVRKLLLALTSRSSRCFAQVWLLFVALPLNLLATAHFQLTSTTGWRQFGQKLPLGSLWRAAFGESAFGGIWKSSSYPSYWLRGRGGAICSIQGEIDTLPAKISGEDTKLLQVTMIRQNTGVFVQNTLK